jgi:F-type H+-transporting ATPase subunit a
MALVVFLLMAAFVLWLKPRLSVEKPGATQQIVELLLTNPMGFGIRDLLDENVAHGGRKFVAFVGTVSIFVLVSNLLGVIPLFSSPTANVTVPLACAIVTFLYFNWQGLRTLGPRGYAKSLAGPVPWLAWLILPVELISVGARLLSLTVRLWANIFASELIYLIFLGLFVSLMQYLSGINAVLGGASAILPAVIPLAFVGLHIFVAVIQSFVFTILPSIYLGIATAEEH